MKVENVLGKLRYTLSNDNLKVGDRVYPIANGRCTDDGGWILHDFDFRDFMSGFPGEPHIMMDLDYYGGKQGKAYQVRTDHGYGPIETYYKIIKIEEHRVIKVRRSGDMEFKEYAWVDITDNDRQYEIEL